MRFNIQGRMEPYEFSYPIGGLFWPAGAQQWKWKKSF